MSCLLMLDANGVATYMNPAAVREAGDFSHALAMPLFVVVENVACRSAERILPYLERHTLETLGGGNYVVVMTAVGFAAAFLATALLGATLRASSPK